MPFLKVETFPAATAQEIATTEGKDTSSYQTTGISILVVGAGVGGLAAALECSRKGHHVQVVESCPQLSPAGDQFLLGLSGRRWLDHWPQMKSEFNAAATNNSFISFAKHDGELLAAPISFSKIGRSKQNGECNTIGVQEEAPNGQMRPDQPPMQTHLRPLLSQVLYRQLKRLNISVNFNKRAISYFEDEGLGVGGVNFQDGTSKTADLVIAADGVGSKSQNLVSGGEVRSESSGRAMYRSAFPTEIAMQDPVLRENFGLIDGKNPIFRAFYGPSTHAMVLTRADMICWGLNYDDSHGSSSAMESWHAPVSNSTVLNTISQTPGWSLAFQSLVSVTPRNHILNWPLLTRNLQPTWYSPATSRVLQLGDAAHTFLPTSGNGATQAIEDAVTIAACLQLAHAANNHHPNISLAVRTHNKLRHERVSCAQLLGFANAAHFQHTDFAAIRANPAAAKAKVPRWLWSHDPEKYAEDSFTACAACLEKADAATQGEWTNTNVPPGFVYEPWTVEGVMRDGVQLSGDWS